MLDEIWKDVEGFNGRYIICNDGTVISKTTTDKLGRDRAGSELAQIFTKGYLMVRLSEDNVQKQYSVAELVIKHFSDQWFEGCLDRIIFLDNNGLNCNIENLKVSEQPLSEFYKENLVIKTRKLIKESKPKPHRHTLDTLRSLGPNQVVKQIIVKTENQKKQYFAKNVVKITLEGNYDDKVELIKTFTSLSDKYDIETINGDTVKFRKKVTISSINKVIRKPAKKSIPKPPSPPLGFCAVPGYKGKYLISKQGKILCVTYNKNKKEWVSRELKYDDTGTALKVTLSINGSSTVTRVAALMLLVFARVKNTHRLRISYKDGNYKNISFDNLIFE